MRVPWKLVGLAGAAGVAATGVVVVRKRRNQTEYDPDELRSRLHERLGEVAPSEPAAAAGGGGVAEQAASAVDDGGSAADGGGDTQPGH
jgi:hypothetical protein